MGLEEASTDGSHHGSYGGGKASQGRIVTVNSVLQQTGPRGEGCEGRGAQAAAAAMVGIVLQGVFGSDVGVPEARDKVEHLAGWGNCGRSASWKAAFEMSWGVKRWRWRGLKER